MCAFGPWNEPGEEGNPALRHAREINCFGGSEQLAIPDADQHETIFIKGSAKR